MLSNINKCEGESHLCCREGDNEGMLGNNVKKTLRDDKGKENDKGM